MLVKLTTFIEFNPNVDGVEDMVEYLEWLAVKLKNEEAFSGNLDVEIINVTSHVEEVE